MALGALLLPLSLLTSVPPCWFSSHDFTTSYSLDWKNIVLHRYYSQVLSIEKSLWGFTVLKGRSHLSPCWGVTCHVPTTGHVAPPATAHLHLLHLSPCRVQKREKMLLLPLSFGWGWHDRQGSLATQSHRPHGHSQCQDGPGCHASPPLGRAAHGFEFLLKYVITEALPTSIIG